METRERQAEYVINSPDGVFSQGHKEMAQAYLDLLKAYLNPWIPVENPPKEAGKYPTIRYVRDDGGWYGRQYAFWNGEEWRVNGKVVYWMDDTSMPDLPNPPKE